MLSSCLSIFITVDYQNLASVKRIWLMLTQSCHCPLRLPRQWANFSQFKWADSTMDRRLFCCSELTCSMIGSFYPASLFCLVTLEHLQRNNVNNRNSQILSWFLLEFDSVDNTFEMYLLDKRFSHHVSQYLLIHHHSLKFEKPLEKLLFDYFYCCF